jgi:hypothetical protein
VFCGLKFLDEVSSIVRWELCNGIPRFSAIVRDRHALRIVDEIAEFWPGMVDSYRSRDAIDDGDDSGGHAATADLATRRLMSSKKVRMQRASMLSSEIESQSAWY